MRIERGSIVWLIRIFLLAALLLCVAVDVSGAIEDRQTHRIDLPEQNVAAALNSLSQQIGVSVLFPYDIANPQVSRVVVGEYSLQYTLNELLRETDLSWRLSEKGIIVVYELVDEPKIKTMKVHMKPKKNILSMMIGVIVGVSGAQGVAAQDGNDDANNIEEIIVYGIQGGLADAIDTKRHASSIVDAISLEDIGKLPDQNIAEALQRLPGVLIQREGGEGQKVSIRGLSSALTRVTVDGNVLPNSNGGREFSFDILAPELVSGLQVYKSPTAKLTEGGVGGLVNISLSKPLDNPGQQFRASVGMAYDEFRDESDPGFSALYSNSFADDTFGIAVSYSKKDKSLREDRLTNSWKGVDSDGDEVFDQYYTSNVNIRQWLRTSETTGATLSLQWRPNDNINAYFNVLYAEKRRPILLIAFPV